MPSRYATDIRVALCGGCGAPIEIPIPGGTTHCPYCNAKSDVVARTRLASYQLPPPPRLGETERMLRLWSQVDHRYVTPAGVASMVKEGPLGIFVHSSRHAEALQTWQNARRRCQLLQLQDAAEDLYCLTTLLANVFQAAGDHARHRAILESALEAFFVPRHRSMAAAELASAAARDGDVGAAERWCALVDANADDLMADSQYRVARSGIAVARKDWNEVLVVLGNRAGKIPIHETSAGLLTAMRAHAWEQVGPVDAATNELASQMQRTPGLRAPIERAVRMRGLCARSFPAAVAMLARR